MALLRSLSLVVCGLFAASAVQAVGFGRPPAGVTLGSPLDFALPLKLDPDERFEPECISAEAWFGDRRVAPYNLRWAIEPGSAPNERLVRVISLVVVDEPVVTLQLTAGCGARLARRFTAFADPPLDAPALPAVAAEPSAPMAAAPTAARAPAGQAVTTRLAAAEEAPKRPPRARNRRANAERDRPPARTRTVQAVPKPAPRARLSLEAPEPSPIEQAVAAALAEQQASAVQTAALSATAAANAASAAEARVKALEGQVERLLADGKQQREQLQSMRTRAASGEAASRWLPWLLVALGLMAVLIAWLALRLRQLRRHAHEQWWTEAAEVLADARPDPHGEPPTIARPAPAQAVQAHEPALDLMLPSEPPALDEPRSEPPTQQAPVTVEPWSRTSPPPRPVSAEELIDLEQQAEFFVVLGQDEAAIDLLVGHLRDSGGASPLPYLKLLEIYRRRGEHEAYERTRSRFNQRFNAWAPDWDSDMQHGHSLDAYPQVVAALQRAWRSPIDAMAELETLLFRKDGSEVFDLPAYRELLMLYALARDLLDAAAQREVDVLLPLPAQAMDVTTPLPYLASFGEATMVLTREPALHTIDLDISEGAVTAPAVLAREVHGH